VRWASRADRLVSAAAVADDRLRIVAAPELPQQNEALTIGSGALIGAAAGYLLPFRFAALVGAVAGGAVAHWWYNQQIADY
jgi:hypothetical protein